MAKFFRPAISITVNEGFSGAPEDFVYRRKKIAVRQIDRRWRIREGWWRSEVAREYFQVETSRFTCMVYRDMLAGGWYLQRIYD
ncbi:MAG: hypothetical protein R6U89_07575 [Dehalococcoidia bacterium]